MVEGGFEVVVGEALFAQPCADVGAAPELNNFRRLTTADEITVYIDGVGPIRHAVLEGE